MRSTSMEPEVTFAISAYRGASGAGQPLPASGSSPAIDFWVPQWSMRTRPRADTRNTSRSTMPTGVGHAVCTLPGANHSRSSACWGVSRS
ncbi:hypothetical protein [Micromonospora sp. NPDC023633]|uniref:hypothetical protein n=1 Tax=Micromonospora sp. NPDC023633 TaxID=3154320 RepID=UPI0033CA6EF2